mgnify:CR=1 FL=1
MLDTQRLAAFTDRLWDEEIVPALTRYIEVPAKSPMFDAQWAEHGLLDRVVQDAARWVDTEVFPPMVRVYYGTDVHKIARAADRLIVCGADGERQRPSGVRLLPHQRYSMWAS